MDTVRLFHADSLGTIICTLQGRRIGIPNLGWYAFRHTYRTLLGTPIGVQQTDRYAAETDEPYEKTKRQANTMVAGKLLPESMKAASRANERNRTGERKSVPSRF